MVTSDKFLLRWIFILRISFVRMAEENEIWINWKALIFCLLKIASFLIITKSAENLNCFDCSDLKHSTRVFHDFIYPSILLNFATNYEFCSRFPFLKWKLMFYCKYVQILCVLFILCALFERHHSNLIGLKFRQRVDS